MRGERGRGWVGGWVVGWVGGWMVVVVEEVVWVWWWRVVGWRVAVDVVT